MLGRLRQLGGFMIRHKFRFIDFSAVAIGAAVAIYLALTLDIFTNWNGQAADASQLEIDELVAVSAFFLGGMLWAVRRLIRERRETVRRRAIEREMRQLAFHDVLTGLPNRRQFDDALKVAVTAPPREGGSHAILMLDLNGFKRVNDVFGHAAGDEVLMQVAARLAKAVRERDMVARFGGDEFAVLSTHIAGSEAATGLAMRIVDAFEAPIPAGGSDHKVGAAIGIALMPQDGRDPSELMRKADIALYRAKAPGHSAFRFFEEEMDARVRERDMIERELRAAIAAGEIVPYYQPLIDLKTGHVRGFEALARWTHREMGEIRPERFIPIAEDGGLIAAMTKSLLDRAAVEAGQWPSEVELAFNISPVLLRDPGFGLRLLSLLARNGIPPSRLELEITESALVRDLDAAKVALESLREAGVRIALDDFGTGYSSLYHLRNFKLDRIKIDRSFVGAILADAESAAIVQALIGLGSGLGLEVTAEGIETEEQQALLETQGCLQGQGGLYSGAVSGEETLRLLSGHETWRRRA